MPLTPTQTRARLDYLNILPRKNLGQNFLVDGNIVKKSLALGQIVSGDTVVEVGPGLGTLCTALLEAGAEVFAVEIDLRLAEGLRETLGETYPDKFHLLEGDGVEHPLAGLPAEHPAVVAGTFKVVANLPYAISTPWLDALLSGPLPEYVVLMLQREAAERFTAEAGTAERGAISIFAEAAFLREPGHPVSRTCFFPPPKVDSFLLCLRRRPDARVFAPGTKKLIRAIFTQRRKQLGSLVRRLPQAAQLQPWLDTLPTHGVDSRARPEELPLGAWLELDRALRNSHENNLNLGG